MKDNGGGERKKKNNDECDYRETDVWLKDEFCAHASPSSPRHCIFGLQFAKNLHTAYLERHY